MSGWDMEPCSCLPGACSSHAGESGWSGGGGWGDGGGWGIAGAGDSPGWVNGLNPPAKALAAMEQYRADQDPVGEFLKARYEICPNSINRATGAHYEIATKAVREDYLQWCGEEGLHPMSARTSA